MSAYVYVEGGGSGADSKELDIRCRITLGNPLLLIAILDPSPEKCWKDC